MSDQKIENEIQAKGLNAPRITPDHIESVISSEHYFTAADGARFNWLTDDHDNVETRDAVDLVGNGLSVRSYSASASAIDAYAGAPTSLNLLTFCVLVLKNGFTVTGESACASPENFDAELGRKIARRNAVDKIWLLEGYLLKQRLSGQ